MPKVVSDSELEQLEPQSQPESPKTPRDILLKQLEKKKLELGEKSTKQKPKRKPGRPPKKKPSVKNDSIEKLSVLESERPDMTVNPVISETSQIPPENDKDDKIKQDSIMDYLDSLIIDKLIVYADKIISNHLVLASSKKHPQLAYRANKDLLDRLWGKPTTRKAMDEADTGLAVRMAGDLFTREEDMPDSSERPEWADDDADMIGDETVPGLISKEDLEALEMRGDIEEEDEDTLGDGYEEEYMEGEDTE